MSARGTVADLDKSIGRAIFAKKVLFFNSIYRVLTQNLREDQPFKCQCRVCSRWRRRHLQRL